MTKILITGGNGFVAHHIIEHILKTTDWNIVTLDRLSNPNTMGYDKLRDIGAYDSSRLEHYNADLNQKIGTGLAKELGEFNYILHIAANSHVDTSITSPVDFIQNNVTSTLNILEYSRTLDNLDKFLYFSTDEVYGTAPEGVDYKEGDRHNPGNPYSASKAAAEDICRAYANTYRLPIVITNGMNILGERQDPEKFFPKVINYVLDGSKIPIHSSPDKKQAGKRHYIHARNVASAIVFVLTQTEETLSQRDASLGQFNIVGEKEFDNLELAKFIANHLDMPLNYEMVDFHSSRPGHDMRYGLDGGKLERLGWKPPLSIEESMRRIIDWSLRPENLRWLGRE